MSDQPFSSDPIAWFLASFARAKEAESFDPCRAALATVDAQGAPSVRFVLVRRVDARGFAFFTNLHSAKGKHIAAHPRAALAFHWASISQQVRIEGEVEPVSDQESDEYFATRPRGSQLSAWTSAQSEPIESRFILEKKYEQIEQRFASTSHVPRPDFWGGLRIKPVRIEFWIDQVARLHDRFSFTRELDAWRCERLQP